MTTEKLPIKCIAKDFNSSPFYFIETDGTNKRYIASFQDKEKIKLFIFDFIENSHDDIQIKIRDFDDKENPIEYVGQTNKTILKTTLNKYESFIIHDGFHDLMLRRPETNEYIAFEEHGLIFIYSNDNFADKLENLGLSFEPNAQLILNYFHWHYRPENGQTDLEMIIKDLNLNKNNWH